MEDSSEINQPVMEISDSSEFNDYDPKNPEIVAQEKAIIRDTRAKALGKPAPVRKMVLKNKKTKTTGRPQAKRAIEDDDDEEDLLPMTPPANVQEGDNVMLEEEDEGDDDIDDVDEDEETQFKKIKMSLNAATSKTILDFHHDLEKHSIEEIQKLATLVRNNDGVIVDDLHKTTPILTKYEKTRVIGVRCRQLENGAIPLVDLSQYDEERLSDYFIATLELNQRALPFIIRRPLPNGMSEYWNVRDLEVL